MDNYFSTDFVGNIIMSVLRQLVARADIFRGEGQKEKGLRPSNELKAKMFKYSHLPLNFQTKVFTYIELELSTDVRSYYRHFLPQFS